MTLTKTDVFAQLRERGVTRARVEFSGGHDEGGATEIALYSGDEQIADLPTWSDPEEPSKDAALIGALVAPIYERWGDFDGPNGAEGTLTWDVVSETARVVGREEVVREFDEDA